MIKQRHFEYFEGELQLRNYTPEIIDFIWNSTEKDKRSLIVKETKVGKNGLDMRFTSQAYLRIIGKRLKENFPGVLKITATLHTKKRDKELYRITVFFNHIALKKNQKILFKGDECEVISWGKKVILKNVKTSKKLQVRFEDLPKRL